MIIEQDITSIREWHRKLLFHLREVEGFVDCQEIITAILFCILADKHLIITFEDNDISIRHYQLSRIVDQVHIRFGYSMMFLIFFQSLGSMFGFLSSITALRRQNRPVDILEALLAVSVTVVHEDIRTHPHLEHARYNSFILIRDLLRALIVQKRRIWALLAGGDSRE